MKLKNFLRIGAIVSFAALMAVAMAQPGGGGQGGGQGRGQGQGGGRGQGGFGQRGGMMGMQDPSGINLVGRKDVQKDLKLSEDDVKKIDAILAAQREEMQAQMENMRSGGGFDRDAMQAAMQKMQAETKKKLEAVLKPEHFKRLKEIAIQLAGNRALMWEDVQKALKLDAEQIAKIKELNTKMQEANNAIREKMRNEELDREAAMAAMQKNNETLNAELAKILKPEQADAFKAMGGEPFKAEQQPGRGPGGGGIG